MRKNDFMSAMKLILPVFFSPLLLKAQDVSLVKARTDSMTVSMKDDPFSFNIENTDGSLELMPGEAVTQQLFASDEPPVFQLFNRKGKPKYKYKPPQRRNKPSSASLIRLNSQSKKARKSIDRNRSRHAKHQKITLKRQKKQQRYSRRKNHLTIKPSRFDRVKNPKKIRRAYIMNRNH